VAGIAVRASREAGGLRTSAAARSAITLTQGGKVSPLIPIFIFSLAVPIYFHFGSLRLSPYRLLLIATFLPCFIAWISGSLGKIRLPDIFILLTATWAAVVLVSLHGIDGGLQSAGIFVIETFGAFVFARRYIRDVLAFRYMVKCLVLMVVFLLPFALYENVTGSPILIDLFGKVFLVPEHGSSESRLGLSRAQATFEHPILFGVICSSAFALSFYVLGAAKRRVGRLAPGMVAIVALTSLSSGALLSLVIQTMLIAWDKVTASVSRRWMILATLVIVVYVVLGSLSNRSAIEVFISYLTFNADNSYMRIHIWNYGTQSVMRHPLLGTGLNDWERPFWMAGSIDNFWLVMAVRYGVPGFLFIVGGFLSVCLGLGRLKNLSSQVAQCRKGLVITLCGLALAICTVHLWNSSYVLLIFLLGSGIWMFEHRNESPPSRT